jgi:hypothetical protein
MFYHTSGFTFVAKKGSSYIIRFSNSGEYKLINMYMENYLPLGRANNTISAEHIGVHEARTKHVKDKLIVIMD